jgi:hypothetical protein
VVLCRCPIGVGSEHRAARQKPGKIAATHRVPLHSMPFQQVATGETRACRCAAERPVMDDRASIHYSRSSRDCGRRQFLLNLGAVVPWQRSGGLRSAHIDMGDHAVKGFWTKKGSADREIE